MDLYRHLLWTCTGNNDDCSNNGGVENSVMIMDVLVIVVEVVEVLVVLVGVVGWWLL